MTADVKTVALALVLVTAVALSGCVPMVTERWSLQPLQGQVLDAESGMPLSGARIVAAAEPDAAAVSDAQGRFAVAGRSRTAFYLAMPASMLRSQCWRVEREGYLGLWIDVPEVVPDTSRQPSSVRVPLLPIGGAGRSGASGQDVYRQALVARWGSEIQALDALGDWRLPAQGECQAVSG